MDNRTSELSGANVGMIPKSYGIQGKLRLETPGSLYLVCGLYDVDPLVPWPVVFQSLRL